MGDNNKLAFAKLGEHNYSTWVGNMRAHLMSHKVWSLVKGESILPGLEAVDRDKWMEKKYQAAGIIFLGLEEAQKVHVKGFEDDPVVMWSLLETAHLKKRPSTRFNAYNELFLIRKQEDESLSGLVNRVQAAAQHVKDVRTKDFSLTTLDDDLAAMTLIRALPAEYQSFVSSLVLLPSFDYAAVKESFYLEEQNRIARDLDNPTLASAAIHSPASTSVSCSFCGLPGHLQEKCFRYQTALLNAKQEVHNRKKNKKSKPQRAQEAQEIANAAEFAGNASSHSSSTDPPTMSDWNADTGATSHMTPHRHWFHTYKPHIVPIRLADGSIVSSAGIGSVRFQPVLSGGSLGRLIEFERVLHVPKLCSNLLSVLYLTCFKSVRVTYVFHPTSSPPVHCYCSQQQLRIFGWPCCSKFGFCRSDQYFAA